MYASSNQAGNWLECIRGKKEPICPAEVGHRSASVCHLGNIGYRLGRKLTWDATAERFVDDAAANRELARFANSEMGVGAELVVVPAAGWRRGVYYDATGLPWVRPSPAMPGLESALHYPGLCLFEGTNLSVGRGGSIRRAPG